MALANVAWVLASNGLRTLVVDWDLEAPGLHRYFHPFLDDKELVASKGIIDLMVDFAAAAFVRNDWQCSRVCNLDRRSALNTLHGNSRSTQATRAAPFGHVVAG